MKKKTQSTKENQPRMPQKPVRRATGERLSGGLTAGQEDIVDLILRDHKPLKQLIEVLKDGEKNRAEKEAPLEKFVPLLVSHAKAEEQSLYVQMKETKDLRMEGYEGDTEHAIAEQLVHEINATPDDHEWSAKVKVLAELVEHHIEEEEEEMLEAAKKEFGAEVRKDLGSQYTQVKTDLDVLFRPRSAKNPLVTEHRLN